MAAFMDAGAALDPFGIATQRSEIFIRHDVIGREAADAAHRHPGQTPDGSLQRVNFSIGHSGCAANGLGQGAGALYGRDVDPAALRMRAQHGIGHGL